jgi:hypothetical protein
MKEVIFADKDNYKSVAHQLRFAWVKNILSQTGMDLTDCFPESDDPEDHTIEQRAKLKKILTNNNILIVDGNDDSLIIYIQEHIIAQWKKPLYDKREDFSKLNRKERFYIGINLEYESVFDQEVEEE